MGIIFESYTPAATATAQIPPVRGFATSAVNGAVSSIGAMRGIIPQLRGIAAGAAEYAGVASGALPRLRGVAASKQGNRALGLIPPLAGVSWQTIGFDVGAAFHYAGIPLVSGKGYAIAEYPASQTDVGQFPRSRGVARSHGKQFGLGFVPRLGGLGYEVAEATTYCLIVQSPGVMQIDATAAPILFVHETLAMSGAARSKWIQSLQDRVRIAGTPATLLDALANARERLSFRELVGIAYALLVQESVAIGGTPTGTLRHALQLADALTLVSGQGSALDAQVTVATAFALADTLASVYPDALAETVDLSGAVAETVRATLKLLDALRVQGGATPGVTWLVTTDETFELTEATATTATLNALLSDGMEMMGELRFEDGAYLAWVVNTESRAFVKYRNFPFNSFARIGDRYFGCAGDGIYELAGDDDAGEPIAAVLRGGLSDLGSSLLKRFPAAYLGYRADGAMVLKVTVMQAQPNGDLQREEHWYSMEPRQANALRVNRAKLGRGLKSTYWGWELVNVDGADFALDSFSWYPVTLERRLN